MSEQQRPRGDIPADPRKLYVSNLDPAASTRKTEADLHELFDKYGQVISVSVKRNEKHNKVYAFILYKDEKHAADALENLDNEYIGDTKIRVELQKGSRGQERKREGGSSTAVTCYRCRQVGHFARECPSNQRTNNGRHDRHQDRKESRRKHRSRDRKRKHSSSNSSSSSDSSSSSSHKNRRHRKHREKSSSSSSSSSAS